MRRVQLVWVIWNWQLQYKMQTILTTNGHSDTNISTFVPILKTCAANQASTLARGRSQHCAPVWPLYLPVPSWRTVLLTKPAPCHPQEVDHNTEPLYNTWICCPLLKNCAPKQASTLPLARGRSQRCATVWPLPVPCAANQASTVAA